MFVGPVFFGHASNAGRNVLAECGEETASGRTLGGGEESVGVSRRRVGLDDSEIGRHKARRELGSLVSREQTIPLARHRSAQQVEHTLGSKEGVDRLAKQGNLDRLVLLAIGQVARGVRPSR